MSFKNKKVTVFGLGISGKAAAIKLSAIGASVLVTEAKPKSAFEDKVLADLNKFKIETEFGGHTEKATTSTDFIVVSPGIHLDLPLLEEARTNKIPIISEIELAARFLQKPIIGVTGTNGKTTTTTLIGEMLKAAGKKVAIAGNIGYPLVSVDDADLDFIVAEISSYQLESISSFCPWISVLLNIQEDHLQRHHTLEEYMQQKARIFSNQKESDYLVYNADDRYVQTMINNVLATQVAFSKSRLKVLGLPPDEIRIRGQHNLENALAAAHAASLCGVDQSTIAAVLKSFPGVEHRIEFVAESDGIKFYNDSKATNPNSTMVALDTFAGNQIILILGGKDKGVNLDEMCAKIKQRVREVILLGEATQRFENELNKTGFSNIHIAKTMQDAVEISYKLGKPKDLVLLSPACSSFDMFSNFEERGMVFKTCVKQK